MALFSRTQMDFSETYWDEMWEILNNQKVQEMKNFEQHGDTSCFLHSLRVSRYSYYICKILRLEYMAAARGGMLHDLFLYDWQEERMNGYHHLRTHAKVALLCAESEFELNPVERDIILKHMFPVTYELPRYVESVIVSLVDKYCATAEGVEFAARKLRIGLVKYAKKAMQYANGILSETE